MVIHANSHSTTEIVYVVWGPHFCVARFLSCCWVNLFLLEKIAKLLS